MNYYQRDELTNRTLKALIIQHYEDYLVTEDEKPIINFFNSKIIAIKADYIFFEETEADGEIIQSGHTLTQKAMSLIEDAFHEKIISIFFKNQNRIKHDHDHFRFFRNTIIKAFFSVDFLENEPPQGSIIYQIYNRLIDVLKIYFEFDKLVFIGLTEYATELKNMIPNNGEIDDTETTIKLPGDIGVIPNNINSVFFLENETKEQKQEKTLKELGIKKREVYVTVGGAIYSTAEAAIRASMI